MLAAKGRAFGTIAAGRETTGCMKFRGPSAGGTGGGGGGSETEGVIIGVAEDCAK